MYTVQLQVAHMARLAAAVLGMVAAAATSQPHEALQTIFEYNTTVQGQWFRCMRIPSLLWVGDPGPATTLVALAEGRRFWGDGCELLGSLGVYHGMPRLVLKARSLTVAYYY